MSYKVKAPCNLGMCGAIHVVLLCYVLQGKLTRMLCSGDWTNSDTSYEQWPTRKSKQPTIAPATFAA
jgi:hypothetical protein